MAIETAALPAAGAKILVDRISPDRLAQVIKLALGAEGALTLVASGAGDVDDGTIRITLAGNDAGVAAIVGAIEGITIDPPAGGATEAKQDTLNTAVGVRADTAATSDTGTFSLIALIKRGLEKFTATVTALGAIADAAWTSGNGSVISLLKAIATASTGTAPAIVTEEATSYLYIPANSTDTAAGNANDQLDSILVVPATASPGAVSFEDGTGTNRTLFAGGTDSLTTLIPFPIDMRNIAAGTAWEITTGADVAVFVFYRPRA